jgi:uncharacterized membrane protein
MILPLLLLVLGVVTYLLVDTQRRKTYWLLLLGLVSFGVVVIFNLRWPDFEPMGERLRDYAMLAAVMSDPVSPEEPWFAGFKLNYYLNWYRLAALPGWIGFAPWEVYHLLGAFSMSLGIVATAGLLVAWTGAARWIATLLALTAWFGSNIAGMIAVWSGDHSWWGPSRVIKGAINEFPAWSWLLGDLHPHYLNLCALPLALYVTRHVVGWSFLWALIALCAWNYSANAWDTAPALVVLAVLGISEWRTLLGSVKRCWTNRTVRAAHVKWFLGAVGLTTVFSASALHIQAPPTALTFVDWGFDLQKSFEVLLQSVTTAIAPHRDGITGTVLSEFLIHWGVPLGLTVLAALCRVRSVRDAIVVGLLGIGVAATHSVAVLLLALVVAIVYFEGVNIQRQYALLIGALLVLLVPEVIFFDDPYGGDNERMNTIFKFYSFAWVPFMIGAWSWLLPRLNRVTTGALACLAAATMLPWTIQTTQDRTQRNFIVQPKEQGLSYFERRYRGSGIAIQKLERLPRGTVLEAENGAYSDGAFIGTLSGNQSFVGWANHVGLLLRNPPELPRRQQVIREFYEGTCERKAEILAAEGISYAVLGPIEKRFFVSAERGAFDCLSPVIEEGEVSIWALPRAGAAQ